jgi:hypothetical protein
MGVIRQASGSEKTGKMVEKTSKRGGVKIQARGCKKNKHTCKVQEIQIRGSKRQEGGITRQQMEKDSQKGSVKTGEGM